METSEVVLIAGIIGGLIWLLFCVIIEGEGKKTVFGIGIFIDIILFAFCRNCELLFVSLVGGIILGMFPDWVFSRSKYETAVRELDEKKNVTLVIIIFVVMIFMVIGIAYPDVRIDWFNSK